MRTCGAARALGMALGLALRVHNSAAQDAGAPTATTETAPIELAPAVDSLVAEALRHAPDLAAERERVAAARERAGAAGALPYPMVETSLQNVGISDWTVGQEEMSMIEVELRQDLPFTGKRAARRRAATAELAVLEAGLRARTQGTAGEVRALYARLYALDRTAEAARSGALMLQLVSTTAAARYSAGKADMEAQLKSQLAAERLQERLVDLAAERRAAVASLNRILDRPEGTALGTVQSLPEVAPPANGWQSLALANSPDVAAERAALAAAEQRVDAERHETRPDFFVGAGYGNRGSFDPVMSVRVGGELPLWGGARGPRVRASEHDAAAMRHGVRRAEAQTRADVEQLAAEWERSEAQIRRYRGSILPQSALAFEAARAGYEAGRGDFSTVVEDFNLWLDAQEQLASREADRFTAWARLQVLVAPVPPEPGGTEGSK